LQPSQIAQLTACQLGNIRIKYNRSWHIGPKRIAARRVDFDSQANIEPSALETDV
jgi:hypothetical protein